MNTRGMISWPPRPSNPRNSMTGEIVPRFRSTSTLGTPLDVVSPGPARDCTPIVIYKYPAHGQLLMPRSSRNSKTSAASRFQKDATLRISSSSLRTLVWCPSMSIGTRSNDWAFAPTHRWSGVEATHRSHMASAEFWTWSPPDRARLRIASLTERSKFRRRRWIARPNQPPPNQRLKLTGSTVSGSTSSAQSSAKLTRCGLVRIRPQLSLDVSWHVTANDQADGSRPLPRRGGRVCIPRQYRCSPDDSASAG